MSTTLQITVERYDRMIEAGVFDPTDRIELIRGELRTMNPIGPTHETVVDMLNLWSVKNVPEDEVIVRVQNSVGLPLLDSAPQPDIGWVKKRDYSKRRPSGKDVLLIVEVAQSSLSYDLGEKKELYAEARIEDYWVVNVGKRRVHVFRKPSRGDYRETLVFQTHQFIRPLAFPKLSVRVEKPFSI